MSWDVYASEGATWLTFACVIFGWTPQRVMQANTLDDASLSRVNAVYDLLNRDLVAGTRQTRHTGAGLWVVVDRQAFEAWCVYYRRLYVEQELSK